MREKFWAKLTSEQRNFKWFFDNYIKGKRRPEVAYNTLYQQAKGDFLTKINSELKAAMREYFEEK